MKDSHANPKAKSLMGRRFWSNQEGAFIVWFALMLTMLMGFVGLALDYGNVTVVRTRMQNAVDAAVCGGGLKLPNQDQATTQANYYITHNGFTEVEGQPTFDPSNANIISYTMSQNVSTNFMGLLGRPTVPITVTATAEMKPGGGGSLGPAFNYTLFSNLQMGLNGSQTITGSVHGNHEVDFNGKSTINGNVEGAAPGTNTKVYFNGKSHITGTVSADVATNVVTNGHPTIDGGIQGGSQNISMPDFSDTIIKATNPSNKFNTTQNFTSEQIEALTGSIYVKGDVNINGSLDWSGSILATGTINIDGSTQLSGSNQVFLYSSGGNIYLNGSSLCGNSTSNVWIYAPKGQVCLNGSSTFYGHVIANQIFINGSGDFNGSDGSMTSLPPGVLGKNHVKLIK